MMLRLTGALHDTAEVLRGATRFAADRIAPPVACSDAEDQRSPEPQPARAARGFAHPLRLIGWELIGA